MTDSTTLEGKRLLILIGDIYEDLELWYPKLRMEEAGADVTVAGPEMAVTYRGKNGYPCVSDAAIRDMRAADFDGLIVPGGFMPDKLRRDLQSNLGERASHHRPQFRLQPKTGRFTGFPPRNSASAHRLICSVFKPKLGQPLLGVLAKGPW